MGDNYLGQLGDGRTATPDQPVQVVGLTGVTQATAGLESIVAVAAAPRPTVVAASNVLGPVQTWADGALMATA